MQDYLDQVGQLGVVLSADWSRKTQTIVGDTIP